MSDGEQVLFEYSKRSELGNQDQRHTHEDRPAVTARTLGRRLAATSSGSIVAHALDFVSVKAQIHPLLTPPPPLPRCSPLPCRSPAPRAPARCARAESAL